jgi:hypothetical protein
MDKSRSRLGFGFGFGFKPLPPHPDCRVREGRAFAELVERWSGTTLSIVRL